MTATTTPAPGRATWTDALRIALFIGLAAGVCEVAIALFSMFVLHRFVWLSRDLVWMAPLAAVAFVMLPGVLLAAIALVWRRVTIGWVVGPVAGFAALSLLLGVPGIADYALAIIAAGIGVQLGLSARKSPNGWLRLVRRGTLGLAIAIALLGAASRALRWGSERAAVARLGPAPQAAPNILLIIFDTVRRSSLSLHGYNRPTTPHLTERAREGAVFDFALTTAPWTLPSHASVFTGRYPDSTTGDWRRPVDGGHRTLAAALRDRGYVTGGFVDNLLYTSYESGLDDGFIHYVDYPITWRVIARHFTLGRTAFVNGILESRSAYDLWRAARNFRFDIAREAADEPPRAARRSAQFLEWERTRGERPFFAFINYFEAHGLFKPTAEEEARFPGGKWHDYYDAAIARLDAEVAGILDTLSARGVLDSTIVIVTSDHGEHFGEHGITGHANSLYLTLLRVPLVIRYPRAVPVQRVAEPVTLRDLAATILDLAGVREGSGIPGASLTRFWKATTDSTSSPLFASLTEGLNLEPPARNATGALAAVLNGDYHYIRGPGNEEEIYAFRTDSLETENLIASPAVQGELQRLRDLLSEITRSGTAQPNAAAREQP